MALQFARFLLFMLKNNYYHRRKRQSTRFGKGMRAFLGTLAAFISVQQLLGPAGVFFIKSVLLVDGRNKDE